MKNTKTEQVRLVIEKLSKIDKKKIPTIGHSIDMKKFYEVPEVKKTIKELKELGINEKSLCKMGFVPAGILLSGALAV